MPGKTFLRLYERRPCFSMLFPHFRTLPAQSAHPTPSNLQDTPDFFARSGPRSVPYSPLRLRPGLQSRRRPGGASLALPRVRENANSGAERLTRFGAGDSDLGGVVSGVPLSFFCFFFFWGGLPLGGL